MNTSDQIELPPLILHPFTDAHGTAMLKATAELAMALLDKSSSLPEADLKLLSGRYFEMRMLCFVGRDLKRWMGQSQELVERLPELASRGIREQSFAHLLTSGTPRAVTEKLRGWGVSDFSSLFSRAIGLNALFQEPPSFEIVAPGFLRNYHYYADYLFGCYQQLQPFEVIAAAQFDFRVYASGEYSRMLETNWGIE